VPSSSVNDTSVSPLTTVSTFPKTLTYTRARVWGFPDENKITRSREGLRAGDGPNAGRGLTLLVLKPSMEKAGSPPTSAAAAAAAMEREMWRTVAGTQPE
jgi:hypothetical protein